MLRISSHNQRRSRNRLGLLFSQSKNKNVLGMATGKKEKNRKSRVNVKCVLFVRIFFQISSFYYFDSLQIGRAKGHVKKSRLTEPATPRSCRALRLSRTVVMHARKPELVPNSQLSFRRESNFLLLRVLR